jgi:hypothetical protein
MNDRHARRPPTIFTKLDIVADHRVACFATDDSPLGT